MGGLRHRAEHCARVAAALRRAAAGVVGGSGGAPRVVAQGHAGGSGPWTGSGPRRWWWGIRTEVGVHGVRATGHLVYPVAWVPDVGESVAGLGGARRRRGRRWSCAGRRGRPGCGPWPPGCRTGTVPHRSPTAPWAVARAGARGGGSGVPERQEWRTTPSTYGVCARDRAIAPGCGVRPRGAAGCGSGGPATPRPAGGRGSPDSYGRCSPGSGGRRGGGPAPRYGRTRAPVPRRGRAGAGGAWVTGAARAAVSRPRTLAQAALRRSPRPRHPAADRRSPGRRPVQRPALGAPPAAVARCSPAVTPGRGAGRPS